MPMRALLLTTSIFVLTGCWNGENVHVRLGDVSLGQQLIDLKTALDREAITEDEYEETKESLLALNNLCKDSEPETSWF